MMVIEPGHKYELDILDGEPGDRPELLTFVMREGTKYPGNPGHHAGTTMQEVLRALIERATYVNHQNPCPETSYVTGLLVEALVTLEKRAARRHGRTLTASQEDIVAGNGKCRICGHIGCLGGCHAGRK